MLSLAVAMQDIRDRLAAGFTQVAIEGAVPSATELQRYNGAVVPYIVYNFADLAPTSERGLAGVRFDTYRLPVNFYAIGPDLTSARDLNLKIVDTFLGFEPSYSGALNKRPGGGAFAIRSTTGAAEAFIVMASFVFSIDIINTLDGVVSASGMMDLNAADLVDNHDGTATIG